MKDPGTVAWILLDRKGRPAAELFWDAHTAHVWQTVGYDAFASKLLDGCYDQAAAARDDRQAEELKHLMHARLVTRPPSHGNPWGFQNGGVGG